VKNSPAGEDKKTESLREESCQRQQIRYSKPKRQAAKQWSLRTVGSVLSTRAGKIDSKCAEIFDFTVLYVGIERHAPGNAVDPCPSGSPQSNREGSWGLLTQAGVPLHPFSSSMPLRKAVCTCAEMWSSLLSSDSSGHASPLTDDGPSLKIWASCNAGTVHATIY